MPTAFMRSPADEFGGGVTARDKISRKQGKLLQEDRDQDYGWAEGRVGPQRSAPNAEINRGVQTGSHQAMGQDTDVGEVNNLNADYELAHGDSNDQRQPMSDGEVQSAMHKFTWDAVEYVDQELSPLRALATKYYKGEPFGNEEEGRSQVVITELRDTVLMILPSLMRIFFGAERAVDYGPRTPEQVDMAEQLTQYIWDIVCNEDNQGFLTFYEWFKDALVKRLGIVKYWYDDSSESRTYEGHYMPLEEIQKLEQDTTITINEVSPSKNIDPVAKLYDVEYTQVQKTGRVRFHALPPEEYIFTRGARTVDSAHWVPGVALFVGHRTQLTRSQLKDMGVSEEDINEYGFKDISLDMNQEEIERQAIVKPDASAIGPIATQKALYIEGYPYLDCDGDGIAELRKVVMLGASYHVISNEPCARRPFAVLCPDPEPHTIIGQGVSDWTMDLQRINSNIWRSMLDSLALTIHPRFGYVEGEVSLADVLNTQIGAPIRMRSPNALVPVEHNFVGREALAVLDKTTEIKENRSGVTKASAGLDADAMQSTTKAAVSATISSAQAHIELIARMFAETGVKALFKGLLQLVVENPPAERIMRSQGKYVPINPASWDTNLDVCVKVAIGAGMDEEKYQALMEAREEMKFILSNFGLSNPVVTLKQYRDTNVKMLKLRGRMDAEAFFQDVDPNWQPPPPPVQDPNMVIAQAEQHKAETARMVAEAKASLEQQKHQMELQSRISELELKLQEQTAYVQNDMQKAALQAQTQLAVAEINKQAELRQQDMDIAVQRVEALLGHYADVQKNHLQASASVASGAKEVEVEHDEHGRIRKLHIKQPDTTTDSEE